MEHRVGLRFWTQDLFSQIHRHVNLDENFWVTINLVKSARSRWSTTFYMGFTVTRGHGLKLDYYISGIICLAKGSRGQQSFEVRGASLDNNPDNQRHAAS